MRAQRTIRFRIPEKIVASLDAPASEMDRNRSYLLEKIEDYLGLNRYEIGLVKKGVTAARRLKSLPQKVVSAKRKMVSRTWKAGDVHRLHPAAAGKGESPVPGAGYSRNAIRGRMSGQKISWKFWGVAHGPQVAGEF